MNVYTIRCTTTQDAEATRRAFEAVGFPYRNVKSPNLRNAGQFETDSDPGATLRRFGLRVRGSRYELRAELKGVGQ